MKIESHWHHAILTFALTVMAAGILLPLVRVQPESIHNYFNELRDWIRISFAFSACIILTGAMFKLLSPQLGQLEHWKTHPPAWLASLIAWIVVAIVDIFGGFAPDGYRPTAWEWLGYAGGALLIVGWHFGLWRKETKLQIDTTKTVTLQDIENAPWEKIEAWLSSDEPANYDFIENQSVAHRVSYLISEGTRSVGIVGPFGAGKTSIVKWVADRLNSRHVSGQRYFICHHSCWGFETSASAIDDMLGSAVAKLSTKIDAFQVDSLPESYRQTFSAGGEWVEKISNLVFRSPDPLEQFGHVSDLLRHIGGRLVFVVEDLDRNETRNFEIQEVLGFLERLKQFRNLSFILTGGLSSSQRVDYAKLCEHIEYLRILQPRHSSGLIERVNQRCLDYDAFPHVRVGAPNRNYDWKPLTSMMMRDYEELSLPQAVASLLNTPRSLRHALRHTSDAWRTLHGEIDFHHLLSVNILRFGAPECFQFLMRRWDRLRSPPSRNPPFGPGRIDGIRQAVNADWNRTIENVEWNPVAALRVLEFLLPTSKSWLGHNYQHTHSQNGLQQVSEERYWIRAVNESIDENDVRDQEVICDIQAWLDAPDTATELVTKLISQPRYSDIWENLAGSCINSRDRLLLLCEQVICRILAEQGPAAGHHSQGFLDTWRFAAPRIGIRAENTAWLQVQITKAAQISIEMINGLWHYYGNPGLQSIIPDGDGKAVRLHLLNTIRENVLDGAALVARLSPNESETLYQLVFDWGADSEKILADVQTWCWLGPYILDALRNDNARAAANCGVLLHTRDSSSEQVTVNTEVLDQFFEDSETEVIDILESMINQLSDGDRSLVRNVVETARKYLDRGGTPGE